MHSMLLTQLWTNLAMARIADRPKLIRHRHLVQGSTTQCVV